MDNFRTQIYFLRAFKSFVIIDPQGRPGPQSWVEEKRLDRDRIVVELYRGQKHFGVIRLLRPFEVDNPFPHELAC